eukprot:CAMPEP_0174246574 /NCGR_PEP_ID=MMETSP0417-20130205/42139_1 /TAXON_ID=242541 /ORGANISM="Mayorella sp, Strain BSH-02190019" /LENGTH=808 /DNA_ID=CAMNT_0015326427 /DNA_START=182 /DNA_END=2611 /DNA_ORIENTATION=+
MHKIAGAMRKAVSRDKYRFQADGFDLDLTFITEHVIAMGIPGKSMSKAWRNNEEEVARFFQTYYPGHFMVYNLSGISYDYNRFDNRVVDAAFPDHNCPPFELLHAVVLSMDGHISSDPGNVAAVHCLAGRGRTGTIIVCYLLYKRMFADARAALEAFGRSRSSQGEGVTGPSQQRYCHYYCMFLYGQIPQLPFTSLRRPQLVDLTELCFNPCPGFGSHNSCSPVVRVYNLQRPDDCIWETPRYRVQTFTLGPNPVRLAIEGCHLAGDIQVRVFHKAKNKTAWAKLIGGGFTKMETVDTLAKYPYLPMFRFTVHSSFLPHDMIFQLGKNDLDAHLAGPLTSYRFASCFNMQATFKRSSIVIPMDEYQPIDPQIHSFPNLDQDRVPLCPAADPVSHLYNPQAPVVACLSSSASFSSPPPAATSFTAPHSTAASFLGPAPAASAHLSPFPIQDHRYAASQPALLPAGRHRRALSSVGHGDTPHWSVSTCAVPTQPLCDPYSPSNHHSPAAAPRTESMQDLLAQLPPTPHSTNSSSGAASSTASSTASQPQYPRAQSMHPACSAPQHLSTDPLGTTRTDPLGTTRTDPHGTRHGSLSSTSTSKKPPPSVLVSNNSWSASRGASVAARGGGVALRGRGGGARAGSTATRGGHQSTGERPAHAGSLPPGSSMALTPQSGQHSPAATLASQPSSLSLDQAIAATMPPSSFSSSAPNPNPAAAAAHLDRAATAASLLNPTPPLEPGSLHPGGYASMPSYVDPASIYHHEPVPGSAASFLQPSAQEVPPSHRRMSTGPYGMPIPSFLDHYGQSQPHQ